MPASWSAGRTAAGEPTLVITISTPRSASTAMSWVSRGLVGWTTRFAANGAGRSQAESSSAIRASHSSSSSAGAPRGSGTIRSRRCGRPRRRARRPRPASSAPRSAAASVARSHPPAAPRAQPIGPGRAPGPADRLGRERHAFDRSVRLGGAELPGSPRVRRRRRRDQLSRRAGGDEPDRPGVAR